MSDNSKQLKIAGIAIAAVVLIAYAIYTNIPKNKPKDDEKDNDKQ